jgi:hypothetical protein
MKLSSRGSVRPADRTERVWLSPFGYVRLAEFEADNLEMRCSTTTYSLASVQNGSSRHNLSDSESRLSGCFVGEDLSGWD